LNQNTDADKSSVVVAEKVMEGLVVLRLRRKILQGRSRNGRGRGGVERQVIN
jgi:hypothetical protein